MPAGHAEPRRRWLRRLIAVAVAVVIAVVIMNRVGQVDWSAVADALGRLSWWQPLILLAVVALRQVLNASPLHFYIEGVSLRRATQNDLGAILMSMVAPAPANYALRVAMFSSWGVSAARGIAGSTMNTLTLMIARFAVPLIGFALLVVVGGEISYRWADLFSLLIAAALVAAVVLILRSNGLARTLGTRAGQFAGRFRRGVDPERWAQSCVDFRAHISTRFRYGFPRSLAGICAMLADDLVLLVLCLRFVGVPASQAGLADVAVAYLFAFPLTILPFSGIGIVDSIIIAALVQSGGHAVEAPALAALVLWRIFTLGVPPLAGLGAIGLWRRTSGKQAQPT
ncbi:lysylphosphatidylglycerol synthase domain-containing protein [Microlunatus sp. Gsoil 973]|uniref:lysylphosphatidylglycerol synthase domain-containing protein n=1 Tax=Microlunatus sp. Gsoil 973 TaxID=2672569 RepID=UPI0012B4627F|nr:lysylphosphatidylglycerol synthase domain-containing protein [Microlunatus sp. Gsoil 973]QGN34642.1 hypothetical protein GJV80_19440 [Microlunatus sp. Gsoil 973]